MSMLNTMKNFDFTCNINLYVEQSSDMVTMETKPVKTYWPFPNADYWQPILTGNENAKHCFTIYLTSFHCCSLIVVFRKKLELLIKHLRRKN